MKRPVERGVAVAFYIPRQTQTRTATLALPVHGNVDRQRICILAQWDEPYTGIARRWKRRVKPIGTVHDVCADRCIRDEALAVVSGAGLVAYFGHASDIGFDGYHGIALEDMRLNEPIGVLVSWSCNAIFGQSAFGIRLVQSGLVRAFIGTTDSAARTRDNTALAQIAAESLVVDRPSSVGNWMLAIDKVVAKQDDRSVSLAWQKFRVVGNIDEPLPSLSKEFR
ncbi:hypothetical protein [Granulosicoccus antarcticus]|uniref:hypothetical protein n=1 Tax=Granulosicoccus antarcticus TaxID=437505 RepID=UPI0012FD55B4|nr:hypothetical protein [Granulosicoccus antarcticus]